MSSISSVSSYGASSVFGLTSGTSRPPSPPKPDALKLAEDLFSKLDTSNQGYLEKSDFENAFASISSTGSRSTDSSTSSTGTSLSAVDVFNALDANGDGKLTKTELSDSLKALSDQLDSQFDQSRMVSAMQAGGMPPPPPSGSSGGDEGYTKDQLSSMATELSSTDAAGSSMFSTLAANFDKADSNGDGKVSFQESQAYLQSTSSSSTADSSTSASTTSSTSNTLSESKILRQIEELLKSYGSNVSDSSIATLLSSVSTTA